MIRKGQRYRCQNPNCRDEIEMIKDLREEESNLRCHCGATIKKVYSRPVFRELSAVEAFAAVGDVTLAEHALHQESSMTENIIVASHSVTRNPDDGRLPGKENYDGQSAEDKKGMELLGNRPMRNATGRRTLHVAGRDREQIDGWSGGVNFGCSPHYAGCEQSNQRHQVPSLAPIHAASFQARSSHSRVRRMISRKSPV